MDRDLIKKTSAIASLGNEEKLIAQAELAAGVMELIDNKQTAETVKKNGHQIVSLRH